jgi:hypothetical protein
LWKRDITVPLAAAVFAMFRCTGDIVAAAEPVVITNSIGMEFSKSWSDLLDFGSSPIVCAAGF